VRLPEGIRAIDVHVHPNHDEAIASGGEYLEWAKKQFGASANEAIPIEATAEMYRRHRMIGRSPGQGRAHEHQASGDPQ